MEAEKPTFWFPAKRFGWGWGLPVRWQGWLVLVLYFASICAGIKYFQPKNDVVGFMIGFASATVIFIAIAAWKGEKPLAWRWGGK